MSINLENMSSDELRALISDAQRMLKTVDARRKAEAKRAAEKAVKQFGYSLDDILASGGTKGSKGAPRYANPADPAQTWTGRGRKPNWVNEALAQGKSIDDLAL